MKNKLQTFKYDFNDIKMTLNIESKEAITSELLESIKNMIHKDRLFYIESDFEGLTACDSYIYSTCYSMENIKILNTYGEGDKILKSEFTFKVLKHKEVKEFDVLKHKLNKEILKAILN